ncbi:MAG: Lrp/AsnC family transcriptional regulator [Lachnospiraceae bacterium]|nr:Lrp/AsnC family transcriptional regulator [Lachnospiraceae bacterium]
MTMDVREELLRILEKNSRIDTGELAVLLGATEVDVVNEMAQMEKEGIICGYATVIDWEKTSNARVSALIEVRVTPQRGKGFDDIAERIYKYPEVTSLYLISGGCDLMVTIDGRSMKEIAYFVSDKLSTLDEVVNCTTQFILKKYKDHGTVLTRKYEDKREKVTP